MDPFQQLFSTIQALDFKFTNMITAVRSEIHDTRKTAREAQLAADPAAIREVRQALEDVRTVARAAHGMAEKALADQTALKTAIAQLREAKPTGPSDLEDRLRALHNRVDVLAESLGVLQRRPSPPPPPPPAPQRQQVLPKGIVDSKTLRKELDMLRDELEALIPTEPVLVQRVATLVDAKLSSQIGAVHGVAKMAFMCATGARCASLAGKSDAELL